MKPNFALTLSFDGIGVLHRAFPGWHLVGDVALDSPDLSGELGRLREMALALDASGLRTKLVIPNDQIKYIQFDTEGLGPEEVADAVARHLDGATPYALDDLAYDWSISAGQVYVAAVARETLAEAEAFAVEHRFNPLAFVAKPENRDFVGEPWFGETAHAATSLPEGGFVERDTAAIRIIGAAQLPDDTPATQNDVPPDPVIEVADPPDPVAESVAESKEDDTTAAAPAESVAAPTPEPAPKEAPAFSSIRASRQETQSDTPRLAGATRDPAPKPPAALPPSDTPVTAEPPTPAETAPEITGAPDAGLSQSVATRIGASLRPTEADRLSASDTPASQPASPLAAPADTPAGPAPESEPRGPSFFTRRSAGLKRALARGPATEAASTTSTQPLEPQDEEQRMTIFGARKPAKVGGKPRFLGIILTAVLLLFLVGVAAWASIFLDDGLARVLGNDRETEITETPLPEAETLPDLVTTPPDPVETTPSEDTRLAALPGNDLTTTDDPALDPRPEAMPSRLDPDQARARYAVTGIWLRAPDTPRAPEIMSLDDFYLTSIDPKVIEQDAVALPGPETLLGDTAPGAPGSPPAPGTTFDFDERGLVRATPEGAVTPEGVRVFAGQPPVVMPPRPAETTRIAPVDTVRPAAEQARLAALRPRPRPGDLTEQNERGQLGLGGRTRTELASLRPRLRPASAQDLAQQAAAASTAAVTNTDADAVEAAVNAAVDPFADATAQAVPLSIKPKTRPNNFARIVDEAEEAAVATPVPASQRVAPSAPTATTVARAATERNALSLRRVNLIGVYGTTSDRRALVRLANGRYKKVKIGDRLDGGRVAAIGTSELRYVKSGRSVLLKMPRG